MYATAFLKADEQNYHRDPNEAYINGKKWTLPVWLMNSEEVCEWLSASERHDFSGESSIVGRCPEN